MRRAFLIPVLSLIAAACVAAAIGVDALIKDADKHNEKRVTATGTVENFRARTSRAGNKYATFRLKGKDAFANVYYRGELKTPPKNGDRVEVTGVFRKEKKVNESFTVKNEIDASGADDKPAMVKIMKK
jgi:cytochrome c-type biogenesis protein CcmE